MRAAVRRGVRAPAPRRVRAQPLSTASDYAAQPIHASVLFGDAAPAAVRRHRPVPVVEPLIGPLRRERRSLAASQSSLFRADGDLGRDAPPAGAPAGAQDESATASLDKWFMARRATRNVSRRPAPMPRRTDAEDRQARIKGRAEAFDDDPPFSTSNLARAASDRNWRRAEAYTHKIIQAMQFNDAAVYAAAGPALCSVARAAAAAHEWHVALLAFESALKVLRKTHALAPPGELVDETDALILDVQESCVILTQHASVAHEWMWAANAVLAAGLSPEDRREDRKALARVPLRAYNLTISICAEAHQWRAALGILNEMAREGVLPTTETYIHVARAAFRGRAAEVTLGMLGALRHRAHRDSPDKFQVAAVDLKTMYSICLGACRDAARRATQQEDSAEEQAKATKFRGFSDDTPAYDVPQSVSSQSASSQRGFGPLRRAKDDDDDASPRLLEYHRARRKPARWANSTLTLLHMADADQINLGPSTRADAVIAVIVGGSPREACDIVSRSHPDVVKFIPQDIRKMLRQAALDIAGGDEDAPLVRLLGR